MALDLNAVAGDLKVVYGDFQWLLPESAHCQRMFPFSAGDAVGSSFNEALAVTSSWSLSFLGTSGNGGAGDGTLTDGTSSTILQAAVQPAMVVLSDKVSYAAFDRAPDGGKKAFQSMGAFVGKNLAMQMRRVLEVGCLCGGDGWATVASYSGSGTGSVTIDASSLRPGVLAVLEGALIDIVRAGNIVADGGTATPSAGIKVLSVDIDNATITFAALPYIGSNAATPQAGDLLYFHGAMGVSSGSVATAVSQQEMVGLRKQVSATSGTIFGINKATYLSTRGSTVSSLGAISAGSLLKCVTKAINRGFQGRAVAFLSPLSWSELNARVISQQMFDESYSTAKASEGSDAIEVRGQGVVVEVYPHPMQADGELLIVPKDMVKRIGSAYENSGPDGDTDISFMIPGSNLRFIDPVPGYAQVKVEARSDQQIYLSHPAYGVLATGITHA